MQDDEKGRNYDGAIVKEFKTIYHPEGPKTHFWSHQYFDIIFNLSLDFSQILLFFWIACFWTPTRVFQDLSGTIITLNWYLCLSSLSTKLPHAAFCSINPPCRRALKLKIQSSSVLFDLLPHPSQKDILQRQKYKNTLTLYYGKSQMYTKIEKR